MLARLTFKTCVRLDDKVCSGRFQFGGEGLPVSGGQDDAEVGHRDCLAIYLINCGYFRLFRREMGHHLMAEQVKINPLIAGAPFGAIKQPTVKGARGGKIMDRKSKMKARVAHGRGSFGMGEYHSYNRQGGLTSQFEQINLTLMDWYQVIKTLHIIGSTVLFGTGMGIAFFMFRSWLTDDIHEKLFAAKNTVLADNLFTLPAVVVQLLSGAWLIWQGGFDYQDHWLLVTYALYILAGVCWVPVVWIQIELRRMVRVAQKEGAPLPERYDTLFRTWFLLGWPAFLGLIVVFYMMVAKPV